MGNSELVGGTAPVVVGDVHSLLRCAPLSRAVIVCGEFAGMSAPALARLVETRAPHARLIRADRSIEITGRPRWRGRRGILARSVAAR
jgi:hypothetical protein